jgi:DNA-binding NarL/FixJ family response regulator
MLRHLNSAGTRRRAVARPATRDRDRRVALAGGVYLTPSMTAKVVRGEPRRALTERELEILALIAEGKTSRTIARKLGVATRTVETHRANMMAKLDVDNAAALARYAVEHGLTR